MTILDFDINHIEAARILATLNYEEEKYYVPELPNIDTLPELKYFADNQLGVAAMDEYNNLIGFLCCYKPWNNAFGSNSIGTYSPIHAHGAIKEDRQYIYQRMYQAAGRKWLTHNITYHSIGLYAHDLQTNQGLFSYGFGLRCVDAIRPMLELDCKPCKDIDFIELPNSDVHLIRPLRQLLVNHLGVSPCFMYSTSDAYNSWLNRAEQRKSRLFVAKHEENIIGYIEISSSGENFVTEDDTMSNICGAYCLDTYRGQNIMQNLLNYVISILKGEGYHLLGVDFESFNPTAYRFWLKYFTPYTQSVTRRIDECALSANQNP